MTIVAPRVLIIEDHGPTVQTYEAVLRDGGYTVAATRHSTLGLELARKTRHDVIVLDDHFPEGPSGREVLRQIKAEGIPSAVIMVSGVGTAAEGFAFAKLGAAAYLTKPVGTDELILAIRSATQPIATPPCDPIPNDEPKDAAAALLGESLAVRKIRADIRRIAPCDGPVLIEGETGTGKEIVARAIHECGRRAGGPFVPVNCAAFTESLLDSELFGHARGAFTGATADRVGLIESANDGTLFLDEICSMPLTVQAKLMRTLENAEVRRLGENRARIVNVRVVAATSRPMQQLLSADHFRPDLLYRLNTYHLSLPPLRMRGRDLQLLANHFLARHNGPPLALCREAQRAILAYSFPGNVRELRHAIERAATFADGGVVLRQHLPSEIVAGAGGPEWIASANPQEIEKRQILGALARHDGRVGPAASELEMSRTTLWRLMRKHAIRRLDVCRQR